MLPTRLFTWDAIGEGLPISEDSCEQEALPSSDELHKSSAAGLSCAPSFGPMCFTLPPPLIACLFCSQQQNFKSYLGPDFEIGIHPDPCRKSAIDKLGALSENAGAQPAFFSAFAGTLLLVPNAVVGNAHNKRMRICGDFQFCFGGA